MVWKFGRKSQSSDALHALYTAIVAQARMPVFYAEWGVPDTLTGRFDMIALQLILVLRRLRNEGPEAARFSQELFDLFFKDMDRNLREMGVGDLSVPKRIEKMGAVFYGLLESVTAALASDDPAELRAVLVRNLLEDGNESGADALSEYVRSEALRMAGIQVETLMGGQLLIQESA